MTDRNLEIALRIKADLESARKNLDDLRKSVKAVGDAGADSADLLSQASQRIDDMATEAGTLNQTLDQTGKVMDSTGTKASSLGRQVAMLGQNLASGNYAGAAANISTIGIASKATAIATDIMALSITGVVGIVALLSVAAVQGYLDSKRLSEALITTGNYAGVSASQIRAMGDDIGQATGKYGPARDALLAFTESGKVSGQVLATASQAAVDFAIVTGRSMEQSVAAISKLGDDPVKASQALDQQYHYLSTSALLQIERFQDEGNAAAAVALAYDALGETMAKRAAQIEAGRGTLQRTWDFIKEAGSYYKDKALSVGAPEQDIDRLQRLQRIANEYARQIETIKASGTQSTTLGSSGASRLTTLQQQLGEATVAYHAEERRQAEADASRRQETDNQNTTDAGNKGVDVLRKATEQYKSASDKYDDRVKELTKAAAAALKAAPNDADTINKQLAASLAGAKDQYEKSLPKAAAGPRVTDNTKQALAAQQQLIQSLQQLQGQLDPTAAAWAKYNETVTKADAQAALAKQGKGANVAGIEAERTAIVQLAAVIRDAELDKIADKSREAWEKLRESLRTPTEVKMEAAVAQVQQLNALLAAGTITAQQYHDAIERVGKNSVTPPPTYQGADAAVGGVDGELQKNIRAGQALDAWHATQLAANETFRQQDIANEEAANAQKLAIEEQFNAQRATIEQARNQLTLKTAAAGFGQLATAAKAAYGEQSRQYRIAFGLQKAAALAQSILAIQTSIAESSKIGFPMNIVTIAGAVAQGIGVLATINSTSLNGYSEGGYTGPGGKYTPVGVVHAEEHVSRREVVRQPGARAFLDDFNRNGMSALARHAPGYADGGFVHPLASAPAAPSISSPNSPTPTPDAGGSGAPAQINQRIVVGLDDSALDDWATSSSFESAVKVVIGKNPSFVKQTVGR